MAAANFTVTISAQPQPEAFLCLPANSPLVSATPFLGWAPGPPGPGGAATMQLAHYAALAAFGTRFKISRAPVDLAAARLANPLTLKLAAAYWTRAFTEFDAASLWSTT